VNSVPVAATPVERSTAIDYVANASWWGYERSAAAGDWSRHESEFLIEGRGGTSTDVLGSNKQGAFSRSFRLEDQHYTPTLTAATEVAGWSLLGWAGQNAYIGRRTIINPDDNYLPKSLSEVDTWIEGLTNV
jgi:hypothetical protein